VENKVIRKGKSVWQGVVIKASPLRLSGDGSTAPATSTIITGATRDILLRALHTETGATVSMMVGGRSGTRGGGRRGVVMTDNLIK